MGVLKCGGEYPIVSIMIATYNSERILEKPLKAIREQSYPQDKIELIIIDGGSTDKTIELAREYGCIVLDNPHTDPVNAKLIGMNYAHGDYLMTVDHDEVLINQDSILNRVSALRDNPECKVAFCSGYKCPRGYSGLNEYISEFGDPFSLFYYRFSKGYKYYRKALSERVTFIREEDNYEIFNFDKNVDRVIVEVVCAATIIDLRYFRAEFDTTNKDLFVHLFYMMLDRGDVSTIITHNDPLEHYSVDSLKSYLPKIRWRIINNIHYADRAEQGFAGRIKQANGAAYRKYLFPLYSVSTIIPLLEGAYYAVSRKNKAFLLHPFLCWYVTIYIVYQYMRKVIGCTPKLLNYDGSNHKSL